MKKWVLILILPLFVALVLTGCCCPKKKAEEMPTTPVAAAPEVKETPPPPEEPVPVLDSIYFDFDKSNIKPEAKATLDKIADWLSKNSMTKAQIEGNCDERGTSEYNMALGERRANSAKKYLETLGVAADRLSTVSFGKEKPMDPGHDEAAWAKNRRDDFKVAK